MLIEQIDVLCYHGQAHILAGSWHYTTADQTRLPRPASHTKTLARETVLFPVFAICNHGLQDKLPGHAVATQKIPTLLWDPLVAEVSPMLTRLTCPTTLLGTPT